MSILSKFFAAMSEERNQLKAYSGQQRHYVADSSSADVTLTGDNLKCRYAKVDVTGIIKVSYTTDNGGSEMTEVVNAVAGSIIQIPNITKVYRYYVGTTPCTAQVYTDAGSAVVGLKLCY